MGDTRRLAEFVAGFELEACPREVVHQAKRCIVETVGCALGGSRTPLTLAAARSLDRLGGSGPASVMGLGRRTSPDRAAFVNGVSANALDYDGGVVLQGHYGGTVVFSALAMAELTEATGRQLLEAVVAAYEVTTRIGEATRPSPEHRRLVSGYGPHQGFAAVVTAGRLLGLDVDRLVHAFGIYGTFAPLPSAAQWNWRNRPLSWTKDMVAWPSVSGINAALLADSGFLGPRTILEGDRSFWRMAASDRFVPEALQDGLGQRFNMLNLYFKAYPTCRWNQAALDGIRQVLRRRGWTGKDVASVEVGVARALVDQQFEDYEPRTLVDAQFSIPYAVALILHGEAPGPHWYDPPLFDSPAIRATMRKVSLRLDAEMERLFVEKRMAAATVTLTGTDGSIETARVDHAHGSAEWPMDDGELDEKFRGLASGILEERTASRLLERMWDLEGVERAAEIGELALGAKGEAA
ncbi:MAG: MmgE/PrpD family protein [Candidatus Rokubacteria bacterium]|nr:MmgE/PrpD family protein [Candidatus Rokubacteria bacterium]